MVWTSADVLFIRIQTRHSPAGRFLSALLPDTFFQKHRFLSGNTLGIFKNLPSFYLHQPQASGRDFRGPPVDHLRAVGTIPHLSFSSCVFFVSIAWSFWMPKVHIWLNPSPLPRPPGYCSTQMAHHSPTTSRNFGPAYFKLSATSSIKSDDQFGELSANAFSSYGCTATVSQSL